MDLAFLGVLLVLISSSAQPLEESTEQIHGLQTSRDVKKREVPFSEGSIYENPYIDLEDKRRKLYSQDENKVLVKLFGLHGDDPLVLKKREVADYNPDNDAVNEFIEDKLVEQGQALEQLMKMVRKNEELTKTLIENLSKPLEQPKMPEKLEAPNNSRRSNTKHNVHQEDDNALARIGKNIPRYGSLLKSLVEKQVRDVDDPTPLLEVGKNGAEPPANRRTFSGGPDVVNSISKDKDRVSWCQSAISCHKTHDPLCGYDDSFGYAKFENLCHVFEVNCYWKYNFTIVSCKPHIIGIVIRNLER